LRCCGLAQRLSPAFAHIKCFRAVYCWGWDVVRAKSRIGAYNVLVMQRCRPFISSAELNASIRIVCKEIRKEIGLGYPTALHKTDIVIEVLDKLVKSSEISPRAAEIFKNNAGRVIVCCINVYRDLFRESLKSFKF
jgi:hypothetical protein